MLNKHEIEYEKWGHLIIVSQFIIAVAVCIIEVINNALLYITRSQGYGPDTIVSKLIRYLFLTSFINFGLVILSHVVFKVVKNEIKKRYLLMLFTTLICTDVAFSHYQFATTLAIFIIPLIISILYEDWDLSGFTLFISLIGLTVAVIARGMDSGYNQDIGPEAAIAYSLTICTLIFSKIIYSTLAARRTELKEAIIDAEKANASAEKMAMSFKMLETLAGTIDAKDKYTNGHSIRVAHYATILAKELGWDEERVSILRFEALLHDIGKIGVPDAILNKPSRLTDTEFDLIKSHTTVGADILKSMIAVPNATLVAKYHHERFDGRGYPSGKKGEDIPLNARVVCIADSFDAMNSDRIYRPALKKNVIREELLNGRGGQFDPELLDVFIKLFDENKLIKDNDKMFVSADDELRSYAMDAVIDKIEAMKTHLSSIEEFSMFYRNMRNIGMKYNRSIEIICIDIELHEDDTSLEDISDALKVSIKKNIRSADVYYQHSLTRHMLILFDAGIDNVEVVQKRIQFDFDNEIPSFNGKLRFDLNVNLDELSY